MSDNPLPRPTARCSVRDCRRLDQDVDGFRWLGAPLAKEEVLERYPERRLVDLLPLSASARDKVVAKQDKEFKANAGRKAYHPAAAAHFAGFWADEQEAGSGDFQQVHVGDFVKISTDENGKGWSIAQVEELYQTPSGQRMMCIHWFYTAHDQDTSLVYAAKKTPAPRAAGRAAGRGKGKGKAAARGGGDDGDGEGDEQHKEAAPVDTKGKVYRMAVEDFDERQVFRARDNAAYTHEYELSALEGKVQVVFVPPQEDPPEDCEFWWTFEFDRRFCTFEYPLAVAEQLRSKFRQLRKKGQPLVLRGMDLYVGAGGLGYMDNVSLLEQGDPEAPPIPDPNGVQVRTDWACDYEADMAATFKANNQHSHVFHSGTDELLELYKAVHELYRELKMDAPGQPVRPWDGRTPYAPCDDDKLIACPRSVYREVWADKQQRQAKQAKAQGGKKRRLNSGAAAAAGLLQGGEQEQSEEEEEEEEEDGTSAGVDSDEREDGSDGEEGEEGSDGEEVGVAKGKDTYKELTITPQQCLPYTGKVGAALEIKQMRLGECAPRRQDAKGSNVAAGLLLRSIRKNERWLEFLVVMEMPGSGRQEAWLSRKQLKGQEPLLRGFVRRLRERQCIPFPGEVDFICGGPPCQGISGNNRHALQEDILQDPRNRQLPIFINFARWFKPKYVLMENVQDILRKEDGMYIKYAVGSMLSMRYQVRACLIAAGNHGVPQGRWRCFMWAAAPGQQLPAIPKPSHNCLHFGTPVSMSARRITSGFVGTAEANEGYAPVLLGDILSDLPRVDNFSLHERLRYSSKPQRITQAWLRRDPRPWMTPLQDRLRAHEEYMLKEHDELVEAALQIAEEEGLHVMGVKVLLNKKDPLRCQLDKNGNPKKRSTDDREAGNHAFETFSAAVRSVADPDIQKALWLQAEASRAGYALTLAEKFKKVLLGYKERDPQLRLDPEAILCDHRPLFCNSDDHWRLEQVPPRAPGDPERNFRSLGGIAENADGTCCYGHSHAPIGRGCTGGGVYEPPTRSKKGACREYRVDAHNKEGWRGGALLGCPAYTVFIPTCDPEVPQWCITFKGGRSNGRGGCFGRVAEHEIIATVVGRAEPHNLKLGHPSQKRTLTIRENARAQGFPDYHVLLAKPRTSARFIRNPSLTQRFQQMGNAVSPQVASALGRCLALAALHESPPGRMLLSVPDPEYKQIVEQWAQAEDEAVAAAAHGEEVDPVPDGFYAEDYGLSRLHLLDNIVAFLREDGKEEEEGRAGQADPGRSGEDDDMEDGEEDAPAPRRRQQKQQQRKQQPKQQQQRRRARQPPALAAAEEEAEVEGEEEAEAMDEDTPADASSGGEPAAAAAGSDNEGLEGGGSEEEEEEIGSEGQVAAGSEEEEQEQEAASSEEEEEAVGSEEEEFEDAQEPAEGSETEADEEDVAAASGSPRRK